MYVTLEQMILLASFVIALLTYAQHHNQKK